MVQEADFNTRAMEKVQGLSAGRSGKYDKKLLQKSPQTFLGKLGVMSEAWCAQSSRSCVMYKSHGIWICEEFKKTRCGKKMETCQEVQVLGKKSFRTALYPHQSMWS